MADRQRQRAAVRKDGQVDTPVGSPVLQGTVPCSERWQCSPGSPSDKKLQLRNEGTSPHAEYSRSPLNSINSPSSSMIRSV